MPAGIILSKSSIQLDAVGQVPFRGILHHYSQVVISVEDLLKPAGEHAGEYALVIRAGSSLLMLAGKHSTLHVQAYTQAALPAQQPGSLTKAEPAVDMVGEPT